MKNNKGFTMIEIITVVIIMGILAGLIIPGVTKMMRSFRIDYYEKIGETTEESAKDFYLDNKIYLPNDLLESSYVNVGHIIKEKYQESLVDYKGNNCKLGDKESYVVVVYKGNGEYVYQTCLDCSDEGYKSEQNGTYCDPAWLNNTNITYDFGKDNEDLYVYYGASREEVRNKLFRTLNVVKKNNKGEELERIVVGDKEEGILPNNIDEVDTTPVLDNENKKIIPLKYKINNNELLELNAVIYRHKAPIVTIKKRSNNEEYIQGTWSNGLIITLNPNDNYFELTGTKVGEYQWYVDGGWKKIECEMTSEEGMCSVSLAKNINEEYKFRIVTNEGNISEESDTYRIKIDVDKPVVEISPNGGESIVRVGNTAGNVSFTLSTSDTGGSLIKSRKYAVTTSKTTVPTSFTNFNTATTSYSEDLEGNNYYVWSMVEDNAGNISVNVWPSEAFKMKYEIKYDLDGGIGSIDTQYQYYGTTLELTNAIPTKTGYKFVGWSKTKGSTEIDYLSGGIYKENVARILYAVWEAKNYTIRYIANDDSCKSGIVCAETTECVVGESCTLATNNYQIANYHAVKGWSFSTNPGSDDKIYESGKSYNFVAEAGDVITLYSYYKCDSDYRTIDKEVKPVNPKTWPWNLVNLNSTNTSILSYKSSYGCSQYQGKTEGANTCIADIHVINGSWEGYYTSCKYCGKHGTSKWCPVHAGGGSQEIGNGGTYKQICDAKNKVYSSTTCVRGVQEGWTRVYIYTISFNVNAIDATLNTTSKNVTSTDPYGTLPTPTWEGHTFEGWYTEKTGGTQVTSATPLRYLKSHTLYARWFPNI